MGPTVSIGTRACDRLNNRPLTRFFEEPYPWRQSLLLSLSFSLAHLEVDVVRIHKLLLFELALRLEKESLCLLNVRHRSQDVPSRRCANILNQGLLVDGPLLIDGEPGTHGSNGLNECVRVDIDSVERL